jgi:hypothetical protein
MKFRDSSEVKPPTGDLEALVARIHQNLRNERKERAWRENAPERRRTMLALLFMVVPLALAIYLATFI